ncbi:hypothetical protein LCGC14_1384040 [marine sediment metagenome]|uniref:Uncharacterized protein n=1 Tax=marine sediment metagenome TaxID=412755 RepID=A0A0F9K1U7_9ZZZZ
MKKPTVVLRLCESGNCKIVTPREIVTTGSHAIIRPDRCLCGRKFRGY